MKKETFIKLIEKFISTQKNPTMNGLKIASGIRDILKKECEFDWWFTQTPARAFFDGKFYNVETPEEFWEYTKIVKKRLGINEN